MKINKSIQLFTTVFIYLFPLLSFSQESDFSISDSLKNTTYKALIAKFTDATNTKEKTIYYAKKIDSYFEANKLPSKEVRSAYELLIENSKEQKNIDMQLLFTKKLLYVDSVLQHEYKTKNTALSEKYDVPKLIKEKEEIVYKLNKQNLNSFLKLGIMGMLLFLLGVLVWYNYRRKQVYKKRFEKLINETKQLESENVKQENKAINIDEKIQTKILDALKNFEENEDFIARKITLASLAKDFETNPKYLSRIVNEYKNKSFSTYISDLRIHHTIVRLKTDETFRKYTINAIASDVGFSNSKSFSNAFYKQAGIYPSYFIKKINESKNEFE
ncbi:helix-turn-helix domain-containing protein [Kordia sp.]|uniref:helix-turn-helix domain-containing protein n=1 Tax=Kordia sp. TaxID=1965332 RepID=UPI003D2B5A44